MDRFEYLLVSWPSKEEGAGTVEQLDALGREGWEAVGITSRATAVPMPGMGGSMGSDIVVLLKRPIEDRAGDHAAPRRRRQLRAEDTRTTEG